MIYEIQRNVEVVEEGDKYHQPTILYKGTQVVLNSDYTILKADLNECQKALCGSQDLVDNLREKLRAKEEAIDNLNRLVGTLQEELEDMELSRDNWRAQANENVHLVEELSNQNNILHGQINEDYNKLAIAQASIDQMVAKYKSLMAFYDKQVGTPCEEIRHKEEVDTLQEKLDAKDEAIVNLDFLVDSLKYDVKEARQVIAQLSYLSNYANAWLERTK